MVTERPSFSVLRSRLLIRSGLQGLKGRSGEGSEDVATAKDLWTEYEVEVLASASVREPIQSPFVRGKY